jgi:uncharacterized protein (TIGR00299 family) protein
MRIAYLDCFAGISGDMLLGALVDAGVPRSILEEATNALGLNTTLRFETVDRSGISATKVHVMEGDHLADDPSSPQPITEQIEPEPLAAKPQVHHQHFLGHTHVHNDTTANDETASGVAEHAHLHGRSLTIIRQLIQDSTLAADVKALAIHTFELLGRSEAKIHNVPVDEIHFHEVGGVDAIADIVASAAGILHLNVGAWHSSPVNVGGGTVRCAHGIFPVPAPATADLLRGFPTYSAQIQKELVTPTGAALLRALSPSFGPQPAMAIEHIGYGAGTRNPAGFPNVLRLSIGESNAEQQTVPTPASLSNFPAPLAASTASLQTVVVLETALDDATPQLLAYVTEKALKLGALDVMLTPVIMKKGRPGTMLTLLANPEDTATFEQLLLRETTTLGIRIRQDRRVCLDRSHVMVQTEYGSIRVKTGSAGGETLNANPEFEDCKRAAEQSGIPLKQIHAAAIAAYMSRVVQQSDE